MEYTFRWPELLEVIFTAAPKDKFYVLAVDASSASSIGGKLQQVKETSAAAPPRRHQLGPGDRSRDATTPFATLAGHVHYNWLY